MSKTIKILTYNIYLRPPPIKTNQDDFKNQRFQDILARIQNYDIICFQELFSTGSYRLEDMIQTAYSKGFYFWKRCDPPSFWPGPVVDSGLLIISKYKILESFSESYSIGVLSDSASDKGYIYCKIKANNCIMHLFSTHLQASYMQPGKQLERELSVKVRLHQVEMLAHKINYHLQKNQYQNNQLIILAGDMNINAREDPFPVTAQSYLLNNKSGINLMVFPEESQQDIGELKDSSVSMFNQYTAFLKIFKFAELSVLDYGLMHSKTKQHPITYGDGETIISERSQSQSKQRLDYIFEIRKQQSRPESTVEGNTCLVLPFTISNKPYTQLSDHYAVTAHISLPNKS